MRLTVRFYGRADRLHEVTLEVPESTFDDAYPGKWFEGNVVEVQRIQVTP